MSHLSKSFLSLLLAATLSACAPTVEVTPVGELPQTSAEGEVAVYTDFGEVPQAYQELAELSASRLEAEFTDEWLREQLTDKAEELGADAVVLFPIERSTELSPIRLGYERGSAFSNDADSIRLGRGQGYQEVATLTLRGVAIGYTEN